jgi:(p)ppGpp synthase/HD superfamily hydrolase
VTDSSVRVLSQRFSDAAWFASELHAEQKRKGGRIPYVAHLMSVSALVLEDGGSEDQAIAGLLHDAIEDQGHGDADRLRQDIRTRFGEEVLAIVEALTDSDTEPKGAWRPRKEAYIARLRHESEAVLRVAAADKLHNARAIVADYGVLGDELWKRFNAGPADTRWYYSEVEQIISVKLTTPLARALHDTVAELQRVIDRSVEATRV